KKDLLKSFQEISKREFFILKEQTKKYFNKNLPIYKEILEFISINDNIRSNHTKKNIIAENYEGLSNNQIFKALNNLMSDTDKIKDNLVKLYIKAANYYHTKKEKKFIFIDNIDRLSSIDRLSVVNKIINWSLFEGVNFVFLTNFEKIKISKIYEEDFWNKISSYNNFYVKNDWKLFTKNKLIESEFINLENYDRVLNIILDSIETFFTTKDHSADIRNIRKFMDEWIHSIKDYKKSKNNEKEIICSFINYTLNNSSLSGDEKMFYIDKVISLIVDNAYEDDVYDLFYSSDLSTNDSFQSLFNNRNLRMQSSFFDFKVELVEREDYSYIQVQSKSLNLLYTEEFKEYNNLLDELSFSKYSKLTYKLLLNSKIIKYNMKIKDRFIIRNYSVKNIFKAIKSDKNLLNVKNNTFHYFEFKNNNIRKLIVYNEIMNNN
ncbi:MAG: hypothetical protein HRS57_00720, partial [Mycoplasmataceae bacterium]|nr:hypothetical protein [Mycoplasmataceae bacterium]